MQAQPIYIALIMFIRFTKLFINFDYLDCGVSGCDTV